MIQHLSRKELDVEKYNACITNSVQSRIYAYSWYLDIVADNWDVLVLNDYEAVMPLPWRKKYFIKYSSQPFFTQQLGVFSLCVLDAKTLKMFVEKTSKKFLKIALQLNAENKIGHKNITKKTNYVLELNDSYKTLYKEFSKGRKHAIQKGLKNNLTIEEAPFEKIVLIAKENYSYQELKEHDFQKLRNLISLLSKKEKAIILGVYIDASLIGGSVFVLDSNRIIYLFSAMTSKGKKLQVPSLLIDSMIKRYSKSKVVLDFEGSMLPNIASFFKSFGAKKESYFLLKKRWL